MGRQKSVAQIERDLLYAKNKAAYKKPDPEENTSPRKQSKSAYTYKPMAIAFDDAAGTKYTVQVTEKAIQFYTAGALNLVEGGVHGSMPRGSRPSKVHAMVGNTTPKILKALGSKRPYIRYGDGTRGSKTQFTYTAPISIKTATAIDTELAALFTGVKEKLGGAYGRVWFEPEYFVVSSSG
jgi:hypothetical protein